MTLAAACGWSLARSLAVALLALPIARWLAAWLKGTQYQRRHLAWVGLSVPFLCPELWTGYAWSSFALWLAGTEFWSHFPSGMFPSPPAILARDAAVDELLLDLLLLFRAVPVGTLAVYFAPPPPLSEEATYCRALALGKGPCSMGFPARANEDARAGKPMLRKGSVILAWLGFALRSRWHAALPAVALMFLVTFQEFELVSLIRRPGWTVWLFDAQVQGLALSESLRLVMLPVACQLVVLVPVAWWVIANRSLAVQRSDSISSPGGRQPVKWLYLLLAAGGVVVIPAIFVGGGTIDGLARVISSGEQFQSLLREILMGCGYALAPALVSAVLAAPLVQGVRTSRLAQATTAALALPGLFGSLVLSLALIRVLQLPALHTLYKTPLALAGALAFFLLPRALVLRLMLSSSRRHEGVHVARLVGQSRGRTARATARELTWHFQWRGEFWSVALLTYWAYLDLTIAYLVAPVTIVSAPVTLYNQMHFGKNAVLSALVFLTVLVPALVFVLASASRWFLFRWVWR
jgi:ABC-type Fe3+ transport system permease subunit